MTDRQRRLNELFDRGVDLPSEAVTLVDWLTETEFQGLLNGIDKERKYQYEQGKKAGKKIIILNPTR